MTSGNLYGMTKEIYESRNIIKSLVFKNLFGRYKHSVLGFSWNFIMPIILLLVYFIVFNQIRVMPIPDFWIYLASGLFPFNFLITNVTSGSGCIVNNAGMIKKMYFPREIIVLSQVISTFVIMLIGYIIILIAITVSGYGFGTAIIILPVVFILTFVFTLGLVLLFSSITVYVRDVQFFLSSISIIFFFLTPMYFIFDSITGIFKILVMLNPFTYFIESFHDLVYYQSFPDVLLVSVMIVLTLLSLVTGILVFYKLESGFAERL